VKRLMLALLLLAAPARAQMGDMRAMVGRPLPSPQLPDGTVHVRVSKQIPINGVPGVEVTAILVMPGGESRKKVATTDAEGWASFDGLRAGTTFEATATVEGETLKVSKFPLPPKGGTRIMLVAQMGGAGAGGEAAPEEEGGGQFALGAMTGKVAPQDGLPAGTLELALVGEDGKPLVGQLVQLGQVISGQVKASTATSDAAGLVRFQELSTGEAAGYAAIIKHQGMRLGTEPFRMDTTKGMRGEIRALGRTDDRSVLRFDERSRIILELAEDAVQVMEELVFKNSSDRMFDPGPEGLMVPLPEGFEGTREFEGSTPLDIRAGEGVAVKAPIPPNRGAMFATRLRFGFVQPAGGASSMIFKQPMPFGMDGVRLLVPANANLTIEAAGLRPQPDAKDAQGQVVRIFDLDNIPAGGALTVTISGLPAIDHKGRNIAGILCLLMIAGAVAASPRSKHVAQAEASAAQLTERREKLFAELVALEQRRRHARLEGKSDPASDGRRQELVGKLENVYRELAGVEHGPRAAT
jgi:hypothetical protein